MKALQMLIVLLMIGQFSYGQEVIEKKYDKEAARVIREAPGWSPAKIDGKPVSVCTTVHIIFSLQ